MKLIPLLFLATVCLGDPALDRPLAGTVKEIRKNPIDDSEFSYVIVWNEDKKPRWAAIEFFKTKERKEKVASVELPIKKVGIFDRSIEDIEPFSAKIIRHEWSSSLIIDESILDSTEIYIRMAEHSGSVCSIADLIKTFTNQRSEPVATGQRR